MNVSDNKPRSRNENAPPPARVAFLITELAPGGAEKALVQLALGLDRKRFIPVVYTMSGREKDRERSLVPILQSAGIETVELGIKSAFDLPRAFLKLRGFLKKQRPDVLQTFMFHANLFGRFVARASCSPVVCAGVRVAERDSRLRLFLDRATGSLVDVWVCVGKAVADFSREVARLPAEKIVSIPNGVRLKNTLRGIRVATAADETFPEASRPVPPNPFGKRKRAIAVGRLTRQKGFDWLLENARKWLTPERAKEWELWIVGDGEERENLALTTRRLGLENDVYFAGWRADISELLDESELFLLPSRWEGSPNALLEAAAMAKPALCARVEGVEEILGDASRIQSCALNDSDSWARRARALMEDEALRRDLGLQNQRRVLAEFTTERVVERYSDLWSRLIERKNQ